MNEEQNFIKEPTSDFKNVTQEVSSAILSSDPEAFVNLYEEGGLENGS